MEDCLFCRIADGKIPSDKVYEDDRILAFRDINPQAPQHILVIPKKHFDNLMQLKNKDSDLLIHIFEVITKIAEEQGFAVSGFRTVINTGKDGQQSVNHLHFHILAGRSLQWPPG